jgi:hypothetical protein
MGTQAEWDAFIAELHSKTPEQCRSEAIARLQAGRRRRRFEPTADDLLDEEFYWDRRGLDPGGWHE